MSQPYTANDTAALPYSFHGFHGRYTDCQSEYLQQRVTVPAADQFSLHGQPTNLNYQQQLVQASKPTCWEPDPPDGPPLYAAAQTPYQLPSLYHPPADRDHSYAHHFDWQTRAPPTQQPEKPEWQRQPYQPLTQASFTSHYHHHSSSVPHSQWYPPSPPNPPQQVQTRCPTSWDPPGYRQQSGFMPYNQPIQNLYDQPALFQHHDLQNSNYVGPSPTTYQQPHHAMLGQPTCQDQPIRRQPLGLQQYDQPPAHRVSCWEPSLTATIAVNQPHQHYQHPRSDLPLQQPSPAPPVTATLLASPLLAAAAVVPPLNMSPLAPPCSPGISGEEGELLENLPPPSVISPPCVPNVSGDEEALLDDEKEVDSVEEVTTVITSFNVARVASQGVENCLVEKGGDYLYALDGNKVVDAFSIRLKEIVFLYKDLHGGDVARMNHRPTLLDGDARLIPPRNDTPCLSVLGRVDKLSILALNFDNHIGPPLMIFDGDDEGRRFSIRCVFDPGGNISSKLLFSTLFVVSISTLRTR